MSMPHISLRNKIRKRREARNSSEKDKSYGLSKLVKNDAKELLRRKEELEKEKEVISAHIDHVQVARFPFLAYEGEKTTVDILEEEFRIINAIRFRTVLKAISIVGMLWFIFYLPVVLDSECTSKATILFYVAIIFVLPCIYYLLSSNLYLKYTQSMMTFIFLIGGILFVFHKVVIRDYSNMVLTLYVILLFTATPLLITNAAAISAIVIVAFFTMGMLEVSGETRLTLLIDMTCGNDTSSTAAYVANATALNSTGAANSIDTTVTLTIYDIVTLGATNIAVFCFLIYVSYYREFNLRKAIISHHLLLTKATEVEHEVDKTHNLLRSMLPDIIAEQLRRREDEDAPLRIAEKFGSVTVMFVEVCHFNRISSEQTQDEVVDILNTVYSVFDSVLEDFDVHKVETVGQVYLVVGGCPNRSQRHGEDIGELALEFLSIVPEINEILRSTISNLKQDVQIRIGLNTGSIVAGVVGQRCPRYKLFGDPVNTASRMQSTCPEGKIQCSLSTFHALKHKFILDHRGSISVKGKGEMDTYFLVGRKDTIDEGRNAIKNKGEMQHHIATHMNYLFRSFSTFNYDSGTLNPNSRTTITSFENSLSVSRHTSSRRLSKVKVSPVLEGSSQEPSDENDTKDSHSIEFDSNLLSQNDFGESIESNEVKGKVGYLQMLLSIFSIGTPEFREHLYTRGLQSVLKFSNLLLLLLPIALVGILIMQALLDRGTTPTDDSGSSSTSDTSTSESSFNLVLALIIAIIVMFIICGAVSFMAKYRQIHGFLYLVVEFAFLCVTAFIVLVNRIGEHPNASFLMAVITFFFNLQLVPMGHRFVLSMFASFVNSGVLLQVVLQIQSMTEEEIAASSSGKKYRYSLVGQNEMDVHDVLLHFVLLIVAIFLQLWCVVIQDLFLFQDFGHNKQIMSQNRKLHTQKAQTTALLSQLLPPSIVPKLVDDGNSTARIVDRFENVTILFTDMVNFTAFSQRITPLHLMDFLNVMYTRFDAITEKYKLYKVEVIGDAYFIVGGCPIVSQDHTERVIKAAQEMLAVLPELCRVAHRILKDQQVTKREKLEKEKKQLKIAKEKERINLPQISDGNETSDGQIISEQEQSVQPTYGSRSTEFMDEEQIEAEMKLLEEDIPVPEISIRIGVHVGSVIAGVVGYKDPRYHIFGDAVSLANMMESKGKPGKVHASQSAVDSLLQGPGVRNVFNIEPRELIDLSPIAEPQQTYFLSYK